MADSHLVTMMALLPGLKTRVVLTSVCGLLSQHLSLFISTGYNFLLVLEKEQCPKQLKASIIFSSPL